MPGQVNALTTDNLQPPYIQVAEFVRVPNRDTQNGVLESTFSVLVVAKNLEEAEDLAENLDSHLTNNYEATDQDIGIFQEQYAVGLTDPSNLYQVGVKLDYRLFEDPNK
ncbi:hypothetical protein GobsT_18550 [Gemmata obscuriglobus]|nr:hypothetical protein GobsT_18550 [Gemmata obscuriglobus]VTS03601.1 unnamed protein product [Gemmata obscuriglobus UQM 2246]